MGRFNETIKKDLFKYKQVQFVINSVQAVRLSGYFNKEELVSRIKTFHDRSELA